MPEEQNDERAFLREYRTQEFPKPSVTVDLVILTVTDADLKVLLIQRKDHPYRGCWALPGGFVEVGDATTDQGESLEDAAHRELQEETGLPERSCFLEQLYTFGEPGRDPRTRVITVSYYALVRPELAPLVTAGSDAARAEWRSLADVEPETLAFDHAHILRVALERVRGKMDYFPLAFDLVPATFTVAELRAVYEAVKGREYDAKNFYRRFRRMLTDGVIAPAPGRRLGAGRPAKVYRFHRKDRGG